MRSLPGAMVPLVFGLLLLGHAHAQELAAVVGKEPPPITVAAWVKGAPLERFEPGVVYVVDFWATWCAPCKAAIPNLTRLKQVHGGKVEVIGVSISERQADPEDTAYIERVRSFVEGQGERMGYRVAVDTKDKQMHAAWFKPAGTGGIPTAYIIDGQGIVAWVGIGSPTVVERIVGEVLAGTFDPRVEAERVRKEEAEAKERAAADIAKARVAAQQTDEKYPGYQEAMKRGDRTAALAALDAAFEADPASETSGAYQWKIMLLLQSGAVEQVNGYGRSLLERFPDNADVISFASAVFVHMDEGAPRYDAQLAHTLAEKALATARQDSRFQLYARFRLGWAQFHVGKKDEAMTTMTEALAEVKRLQGKVETDDLAQSCEDALRIFRKPAKT